MLIAEIPTEVVLPGNSKYGIKWILGTLAGPMSNVKSYMLFYLLDNGDMASVRAYINSAPTTQEEADIAFDKYINCED